MFGLGQHSINPHSPIGESGGDRSSARDFTPRRGRGGGQYHNCCVKASKCSEFLRFYTTFGIYCLFPMRRCTVLQRNNLKKELMELTLSQAIDNYMTALTLA